MPEPLVIIEEKTHRIRALRAGKAIAKAVRSETYGNNAVSKVYSDDADDDGLLGWLVTQVVPTRQAAIDAVKRLAEDAHPNAEVA